jgi:hypothetical protein
VVVGGLVLSKILKGVFVEWLVLPKVLRVWDFDTHRWRGFWEGLGVAEGWFLRFCRRIFHILFCRVLKFRQILTVGFLEVLVLRQLLRVGGKIVCVLSCAG